MATGKQVKSLQIARIQGSDTSVLVQWKNSHTHTENFSYEWEFYNAGNKKWVLGGSGTASTRIIGGWYQFTYSVPSNVQATQTRAQVKPNSAKTKPVKDKKGKVTGHKEWWKGAWTKTKSLAMPASLAAPNQPPKPTLALVGEKVRVSFTYNDDKATHLLIKRSVNGGALTTVATVNRPTNGSVQWDDGSVTRGNTYSYVAQAKNSNSGKTSQDSLAETIQHRPGDLKKLGVKLSSVNTQDGNGAVELWWKDGSALSRVNTCTIEVGFATWNAWGSENQSDIQTRSFTKSPDGNNNVSVTITGLERGKTWYFRVRRKNAANLYGNYATLAANGKWSTISCAVNAPASALYTLAQPTISKVTDLTRVTAENGSVRLDWTGGTWTAGCECEVQYTELAENFSANAVRAIRSESLDYEDSPNARVITVTGLERGKTWYFRLRITNDDQRSNWAAVTTGTWRESGNVARCTLTPAPAVTGTETLAAPTCVTTPTSVQTGDVVLLAWTHNSEQNSTQTAYAMELSVTPAGDAETTTTITGGADGTRELDTSAYGDGTTVRWRVRTVGVDPEVYSPWSRVQEMRVWGAAVATSEIVTLDGEGNLTQLPATVTASAGGVSAENQPIAWWAEISNTESYTGLGRDGGDVLVPTGTVLWRHETDASRDGFDAGGLEVTIGAADIDLLSGNAYQLRVGCVTAQGLRSEAAAVPFGVQWSGAVPDPSATVTFDEADLCCYIWPMCEAELAEGEPETDEVVLFEGVTLSVWRVAGDDTTTLIADGLANDGERYVIDPHPAAGQQAYAIVARATATGTQAAYEEDVSVEIDTLVIQWDESWGMLTDANGESEGVDAQYLGRVLRLPYNIAVDEQHEPDVAAREYLGRENPVSAYGTQRGEAMTLTCDVRRDDEGTIELLRELAAWRGDVYVRDHTGNGYWASVSDVRLAHSYESAAVSVSMEIRRVEPPAEAEAVYVA